MFLGFLEGVAISIAQAGAIIGAGTAAAVVTVAAILILIWIAGAGWWWKELVKYPAFWFPISVMAAFDGLAASKAVWTAVI